MRIIALTGSAAAGKSAVAALFRAWGATVIDADAIVRELQQPGAPVFDAIVAEFGRDVVTPTGALDRAALRRRVFSDADARHRLEVLVHPAVEARRTQLLADAQARGADLVIAEIPLLFESADPSAYDGVIVVDAPLELRRERLMHDRGFTATEADQLIAAQWPAGDKRARATWIIDNDADRAALEPRTRAVWDALRS